MTATSSLRIVSVFETLLGTYGDAGNVATLRHRSLLHDIDAEVVTVGPGEAIPQEADMYVLGGGEDTAQTAAANALIADGGLNSAADRGAVVLAICAGYQLLGEYFPDATGQLVPGLDILDIRTDRLPERAVGELATSPNPEAGVLVNETFSGYENHAGATARGPGVEPLGHVLSGIGNGDGTEGAVSGRVVGTYLHGPCLARNPQLADTLLSWATGRQLPALVEPEVEALRAERLAAVLGSP